MRLTRGGGDDVGRSPVLCVSTGRVCLLFCLFFQPHTELMEHAHRRGSTFSCQLEDFRFYFNELLLLDSEIKASSLTALGKYCYYLVLKMHCVVFPARKFQFENHSHVSWTSWTPFMSQGLRGAALIKKPQKTKKMRYPLSTDLKVRPLFCSLLSHYICKGSFAWSKPMLQSVGLWMQ